MVKSKCSVQGIGPSTKTTAQHCVRATYGSAIGVDVHAKQLVCCYQSSDGVDPLTHQPILMLGELLKYPQNEPTP